MSHCGELRQFGTKRENGKENSCLWRKLDFCLNSAGSFFEDKYLPLLRALLVAMPSRPPLPAAAEGDLLCCRSAAR